MSLLIGAAIWAFAGERAAQPQTQSQQPKSRAGLMTSLPIYWNEAAGLEVMLSDQTEVHWVKARLEDSYELVPLDALAGADTTEPNGAFAELDQLILAQPYALPPADLVALDEWVRGGGKVLIFADPMLTEHSDFGLGDRRRPQDIAMLGPILARWGLELVYEDTQSDGPDTVSLGSIDIPVHKSGRLELVENGGSDCAQSASGVIAQCSIGQGQAVIIADAALLERDAGSPANEKALNYIVARAFGGK
ncbi:Gldg family protein [Pontixanthobacter aquaemixtae]|uniref:ABC transporter n=1 Tax=Pontixanthobacter aquaemixtae TaxID=1958940 RepID=A0A844ZRV0_9SPHN|nr:Gldg family protein [Pontixanthobacter aquaemixtae]MXO89537.1 ABC transporter [Pontixanthobacter aquaemixtae]